MKSDGDGTGDDSQQAKRRERWRRNKQAQRSHEKPMALASLTPEFEASVWAERDRRRLNYPGWLWTNPQWDGGRGTYKFLTDVWAVRTLLKKQHFPRKVTAGMVGRRMAEIGLYYDYKPGSLRTMVYRAYEAIAVLETHTNKFGEGLAWPTFGNDSKTNEAPTRTIASHKLI